MERKLFTPAAGIILAVGITLATGPLWPTIAFADEAEPAKSVLSEPEAKQLTSSSVQVTASRVEKELLDVPMSVSVVTEDQIRRSTSATVGGLLQDVPGVTIVNSGAQGLKRISIRGEDPNRVLILIDGQKIAENKSMDGTPLMIDPSRIERIEVIRGPASVLYGSEALGGVVNIITKKGGKKPVEAEVGATFDGSAEGFISYGSLYGSLGGFNYRVSGAYGDLGDVRGASGTIRNTSYRKTDASAFLSYDFEKLTIGGGADYYDSMVKSGSQLEGYENFAVDMPDWKREKYYAFAEFKQLSDWFPRLRLDIFHQENHKHMYNNVDVDGNPVIILNEADNKNKQFGGSMQADWQLGDSHYLITGYEYNRDTLDATTNSDTTTSVARLVQMLGVPSMAAGRMKASMENSTHALHDGKMDTHAVFAQMETTLPWDFTLNYGMRYTWVRSKMDTARGWKTTTSTGAVAPYDVGAEESESNSHPVFNVGLIWTGIENLSLRATFAQGFRVPSLQERYIITAMGGGTMIPNPDLDPETSNTYEIGARYAGHGLVLDAALFYSDADDYITSSTVATNTYQYINVGSAKTHGLELFASYDLPHGFTPYVSGAWMKRKYDYGEHTTWKSGTPEFTARAGLRFTKDISPEAVLYLDAYGRFSSPWEEENANGELTDRCNNWETVNLALGVDFGKEKEYSAGLEFLNIFDKRYQLTQGFEEPGMHVNARFSMKF